ncbi:MAG: UvrD-helicase domain-containing protein [Planctomycetota bacterium]
MREPTPHIRLVRASAGTGKTFALTTRYLTLLRAGVDPASILATTFTRKAAGEVFERVLTRLAGAVLDQTQRDQLDHAIRGDALLHRAVAPLDASIAGEMLERLVARLDRAAISTIDGFFARLCAAFALELQLPVEPTLTDDGSALAAELRETATHAMLGEAADDDFQSLLALLRQLHHDTTKRSVTDSLDRIFRGDADGLYAVFRQARHASCWPDLDHTQLPSREAQRDIAQRAIDHLAELAAAIPLNQGGKAPGSPKKNWLKAYDELKRILLTRAWPQLAHKTWAINLIDANGTYDRVAYPEVWIDAVRPVAELGIPSAIHELNLQHQATFQLLRRFAGHFEAGCLNQRVLLFADLTDRLARHLRIHASDTNDSDIELWRDELAYRLDGRVQHLLIDEFQDTSVDQFAVLSPIIDEMTSDASDDRSLFVVGDAKQSIYGWRGGRVELFDSLKDRLQDRGLDQRVLDQSYRSSPGVLYAVNAIFNGLESTSAWPKHSDAKIRFANEFRPHDAANPEMPGEFEILTTQSENSDKGSEAASSSTHESAVAEHLRKLALRWPDATLGVLVRTNAQANALLQACRHLGVSASGETGAALTDHPAVNAVLAAMTLADHPGHQVAAFHLTNSPLGEVLGIDTHRSQSAQRISSLIRQQIASDGYASLIAHWITKLAPSCDPEALRRLRQLGLLAEQYQPAAALRPAGFVRFIESARVEDPSTDRIRVMTVHRAKGLEFDAVVLPDLHGDRSFRPVLLEQRDGDTGPITAVYRAGKRELRDRIPLLHELHAQAESRHAYEQLCTLYVALTRAKYATHVLMPPTTKGDPRRGESMLAVVLQAFLSDGGDLDQPNTRQYRYEDNGGADAKFFRARAHPEASTKPTDFDLRSWPARRNHKQQRAATNPVSPSVSDRFLDNESSDTPCIEQILEVPLPDQNAAMHWGTQVHAAMQSIEFIDEPKPDVGETLQPDVAAYVTRALAYEPIRELLARRGASHVRSELPIRHLDTLGNVVRGTIDRLVWWSDDEGRVQRAEIQDFKTDVPATPADTPKAIRAWLEIRRQHHQKQLELYRKAAATWLGIPKERVEAVLVFTALGRVVRW